MIWLGYPEEEGSGSPPEGLDDAKKAIEGITEANGKIDDCELELVTSLERLDGEQKKKEKEDWINGMHLQNVNSDQSWDEIAGEFRAVYSMEGVAGGVIPEAFCTECAEWVSAGGTECHEHGSGPNIVLAHEANTLDALLSKIEGLGDRWEHLTGKVPFGKYDSELLARVEAVANDGACSGLLSDFETEVGKVIEGMNRLRDAIEEMRKTGEDAGGSPSDVKDFVKGIRSLKINTVENIVMDGKRWMVEHRIPGRSGIDSGVSASIIQDMGRMPTRIAFHGVLTGDNASLEQKPMTGPALKDLKVLKKLELLKWFYKKRVPLFFACSFLNRAELATKVMIEDLRFEEEQIVNHQVGFKCTLVEYSDVHWESPESLEKQLKGIREGVEIWAQYQTLEIVTSYRSKYTGDPKTKAIHSMITGGRLK